MSYFPPRSPYVFGNDSIAAGADTRFISPGFTNQIAPTTSNAGILIPRNGILRNFWVRHNAAAGNGNNVVYDVRIATVAQGLGLTLATGAIGQAVNLTAVFPVVAQQLIEVTATKAAGIGSGGINVTFGFELIGV